MEHKKDYCGYVYEWTNTVTGMKYIGSHYGSVEDSYIGSGRDFMPAYDKNPDHFSMTVLEYVMVDKATVLITEKKWLDSIHNIKANPMYYNLNNDAAGGFGYITTEHIVKRANTLRKKHNENGLSDSEKESYKQKIETRLERISDAGFTDLEKNQHNKYGFEIVVTTTTGKELSFTSIRKANIEFGLSIGYGLSNFIKYSNRMGLSTRVIRAPITECNRGRKG